MAKCGGQDDDDARLHGAAPRSSLLGHRRPPNRRGRWALSRACHHRWGSTRASNVDPLSLGAGCGDVRRRARGKTAVLRRTGYQRGSNRDHASLQRAQSAPRLPGDLGRAASCQDDVCARRRVAGPASGAKPCVVGRTDAKRNPRGADSRQRGGQAAPRPRSKVERGATGWRCSKAGSPRHLGVSLHRTGVRRKGLGVLGGC